MLQRSLASVGAPTTGKMTAVQCAEFMLDVERLLAGALGSASAHGVLKGLRDFVLKDRAALQREFARTLASLKMSPKDLKSRIDFQKERETLLEEQFVALEGKIKDRDVEIVADRGIHGHVGAAVWEAVCRRMETAFRDGHYTEGVEAGIAEINALLARHYPREGRAGGDELPNRPVVL